MQLEDVKLYLRVDGTEDDNLLSSLLISTKSYIENATGLTEDMVQENEGIKELYYLTCKILIAHWYENRTPQTTGPNFHTLDFSLTSLFLQLEAEYLKIKRSGVT